MASVIDDIAARLGARSNRAWRTQTLARSRLAPCLGAGRRSVWFAQKPLRATRVLVVAVRASVHHARGRTEFPGAVACGDTRPPAGAIQTHLAGTAQVRVANDTPRRRASIGWIDGDTDARRVTVRPGFTRRDAGLAKSSPAAQPTRAASVGVAARAEGLVRFDVATRAIRPHVALSSSAVKPSVGVPSQAIGEPVGQTATVSARS